MKKQHVSHTQHKVFYVALSGSEYVGDRNLLMAPCTVKQGPIVTNHNSQCTMECLFFCIEKHMDYTWYTAGNKSSSSQVSDQTVTPALES
jgi:hypothetical protein